MKVCERERKLGGRKKRKTGRPDAKKRKRMYLLIGMPPSFKFNAGPILVKGRLHPC